MRRLIGFSRGRKKVAGPSLGDVSGRMTKRTDHLDTKCTKIDQDLAVIKQKLRQTRSPAARANLKKRAAMLLRQRRMYSGHRDNMMNQQFNVDNIAFQTESMQTNIETVGAMKDAAKVLKVQYKKIDIDTVEDLRDEMEDLMEEANEINESLGQSFGVPDEIDDCELMDELDMIEDELGYEDSGALDTLDPTPSGPITSGPQQSDAKQLESELMGL